MARFSLLVAGDELFGVGGEPAAGGPAFDQRRLPDWVQGTHRHNMI
ncbi:MAG TPA: hypothetical protein PL023_04715 [Thiobacillus sp.]|nr:hypothetical protein [Thiobacillus sp.]